MTNHMFWGLIKWAGLGGRLSILRGQWRFPGSYYGGDLPQCLKPLHDVFTSFEDICLIVAHTGCRKPCCHVCRSFFQAPGNEQNRSDNFQEYTQEMCGAGLQLSSSWHRNLVQSVLRAMPEEAFCVLGPARVAVSATTRPYFDWFSSIWLGCFFPPFSASCKSIWLRSTKKEFF